MIERGIATDACPFRHRTRYYDSESWLYYYGYRYYDPNTTKWISKDPIGEKGGWNLTCFCENDPVNGFDPTGLDDLIHSSVPSYVGSIMEKGLQAGEDGIIWLNSPDIKGAGASRFATAHFTYDVPLKDVMEIPAEVIKEAEKSATQVSRGKGLTKETWGPNWARAKGDHIAAWVNKQTSGTIFRMPAAGQFTGGFQYAIKGGQLPDGSKLQNISGEGVSFEMTKLANDNTKVEPSLRVAADARWAGQAVRYMKIGGRTLIVVGASLDLYEIHQSNYSPKVITKKVGAWTGAFVAGGVAAEKASPLLAGGPWAWLGYGCIVVGGGGFGYWSGETVTETVYEWTFE